jgi:hypothetical protein
VHQVGSYYTDEVVVLVVAVDVTEDGGDDDGDYDSHECDEMLPVTL